MTRSLIVEVVAVETPLPAGKAFSHRLFELHPNADAPAVPSVQTPDLSARFDNLADGGYTAKVTDIATDESALGPPAFGDIVVGAPAAQQFYMASASLGFLVI